MKRVVLLLWFTSTMLSCSSQESKLLLKEDNITLSDSAFYYKRTYTNDEGKDVLLPEFKYLDSIQISNITYLSDDLKIKASGGIKTLEEALLMIDAGADRIGTSNAINFV